MSIYKRIIDWADQRDRNLAAKQARKALKKERKFKSGAADAPATQAFVGNAFHSLDGLLSKLFEGNTTLLVKHGNDNSEQLFDQISQLIVKQAAMTDEHLDGYVASLSAETIDVMKHHYSVHTEQLARIHEDLVDGGRQLHRIEVDAIRQLDMHSSQRYLETIQHMRDGRLENFAALDVLYQAMAAHFDVSNSRLEAIEQRLGIVKRPIGEPSLEWLMENYDELCRFVDAIRRLENNDAPPQMASLEGIRSIRAFADYPMKVVKDAIERLVDYRQAA
jgi:hypothetical protein